MLARLASFTRTSFILVSLTSLVGGCGGAETVDDGPLEVSTDPIIWADNHGEMFPDVTGAESAQLLIDGQLAAESEGAPFNFAFATDKLAVGAHEVVVVAKDAAGAEARATAKLMIDRQEPEVFALEQPGRSTGGASFTIKDESPIRMIRLTIIDHKHKSSQPFTCSEAPVVVFEGCEDVTAKLVVQDAATNRSVTEVNHKGSPGRCDFDALGCKPYGK
jgi:hypothetical protein